MSKREYPTSDDLREFLEEVEKKIVEVPGAGVESGFYWWHIITARSRFLAEKGKTDDNSDEQ